MPELKQKSLADYESQPEVELLPQPIPFTLRKIKRDPTDDEIKEYMYDRYAQILCVY